MRVLIAAAVVLLVTGVRAHADDPKPQTSQFILSVPTSNGMMWNPGIYTTAARCEAARKAFLVSVRSIGLRKAACAETLSP